MIPSTLEDLHYLLYKYATSNKSRNIRNLLKFTLFNISFISSKYGISSEKDRDIAVIIVEKPFQLSSYVSPVCLPSTKRFKIMNGKALVSGSDTVLT